MLNAFGLPAAIVLRAARLRCETDPGDVQITGTDVADRERLVRAEAQVDRPEVGGAGNPQNGWRGTPETATVRGPAGSSLVTVSVADLAPKLVGAKRTASLIASPGSTVIG